MSKVEGRGIALKGVINRTFLVILKNKILLKFRVTGFKNENSCN